MSAGERWLWWAFGFSVVYGSVSGNHWWLAGAESVAAFAAALDWS